MAKRCQRRAMVASCAGLGLVVFAGALPWAFAPQPFGDRSHTPLASRSVGVASDLGASRLTFGTASGGKALASWSVFGAGLAVAAIAKASFARRQSSLVRRHAEEDGSEGAGGEWKGAQEISALTGPVPLACDNIEVAKILPHRYPFLLVDKVIALEKMKRAVGIKNVTANEPQFTGHFPDRPIMPGVLMVEALAQLAGVVCMEPGDQVLFAAINGVKFKKPVVPGDTLVMEVEVLKFREKSGIAKITGRAYVDGKLAVEVGDFTCALVK